MAAASIAGHAKWLADAGLQKLLAALSAEGELARIAGGAVRNALLGQPVTDIDIATTTLPDETVRRAQAAGFKTVPTGYEHGTITVVVKGRGHEVTTLRADVETDGRRARVRFGKDWEQDAARRDFTINALYAEADGTVVDLVGGLADLESRTLRFIGDPEDRIREDYLRILRFFRFFAWYGRGRPDAAGVKACARLKDGVARLSAERVWGELKKLLSAPDPARALLWMRQTGVLTFVLPETEKWGIDSVHGLMATEQALGWKPDTLLRLEAIVPPDAARMIALSQRLKLSKAEAERLRQWAFAVVPEPQMAEREFVKLLYHAEEKAVEDRLRLALVSARSRAVSDGEALAQAAGYSRLLDILAKWEKPRFPIGGDDLTAIGAKPGKKLGETLRKLEAEWVDSGFTMSRDALLERAAQMIGR
ncbi:poly(A) polymerase/tRNA nucleotidyltransferase (CCA-adding enzyme) [Mesorhizobium sp. J18]|uniref:CCA tRNA nucleotidyltransferase n=1 Tax=Mesorhizobium sp. J18 TaxID=935263 RepID=UPI00119B7777|nr:CCA tRNA nucleotidyltransferase [Mesorhizobium sp. J18]TWG97132.1 poly(A) polymerase/tRNA nucleotidyltransferase (CCA-adding enzyme) [Mesorhizobium sp. J18]